MELQLGTIERALALRNCEISARTPKSVAQRKLCFIPELFRAVPFLWTRGQQHRHFREAQMPIDTIQQIAEGLRLRLDLVLATKYVRIVLRAPCFSLR
jgi:hypothetical protein